MKKSDLENNAHIDSIEKLENVYGTPLPRSLAKEIDYISNHYRKFIEKSPFVILASSGPEGTDCSPRGDAPGFVRVQDRKTVLLPDRRGNNRLDTLRNIIVNPYVSLLFLIPGIGETLRINGSAIISIDAELCASFAIKDKIPRSVLVITVNRIYYQCQKALVRSRLWSQDTQIARSELPSAGTILESLSTEPFDGTTYDRNYPEHMKNTIY